MNEFTALANRMADEAGEIIRKYYRQPFDVQSKEDESPVTIADREVETRLSEMIETARPKDGILGEEFGIKESQNGLTWVLDPIDGTKPFITGRPTFGTLIALCDEEKPVLGLIDQPIIKDRWLGAEGQPTTHNDKPVKTRPCKTLKASVGSSTSPMMFARYGEFDFIRKWRESCNYIVWGGDCITYGLLANGNLDVIIEAEMKPYDYLAHVAIVEGAGGMMCDFEGQPLVLGSGDHVIALGDADLWPQVQKLL